MLSFSKIVTLSAVAFGALTQALPLQSGAGIDARNTDLVARCDTCDTLGGVFAVAQVALEAKLKPILALEVGVAVEVDVEGILKDTCGILGQATVAVEALVDLDIEAVLVTEAGVKLGVNDVAALLSAVVKVVFDAIANVKLCVVDLTVILGVLCDVVKAVFCLLQAVVNLTRVIFEAQLILCIQAILKVSVIADLIVFLGVSIAIV